MKRLVILSLFLPSVVLAQRLMPQVENTALVVAEGATAPNIAFYYDSVITPDKQHVKMLSMTYLGGAAGGTGGAGMDAQVVRIKRDRLAADGEEKHPHDVCLVDYSRLRPYDPFEPGTPTDSVRYPTFVLQHGDTNHTDCAQPNGLCRDPEHPKRLIPCPAPAGSLEPTGGTGTRADEALPEAMFAAPLAITAAAVAGSTRATAMFFELANTPVKRKFEPMKEAMLNALMVQTPEGTAEIMYGVINTADTTGIPLGASDQRGIDSGVPGNPFPFPGIVPEPNALWCATRNWNYTWRHMIGVWQGIVKFRGQPVCDIRMGDYTILLNRGRCSHAATVMVNWNPCSLTPPHVTGMQNNHGRTICVDKYQTGLPLDDCTNDLHRTAWYVSCPNRTYAMSYASRKYCETFYSAWSNNIPTPAIRTLCPIGVCVVGHNCNDDATYQWWNVAHWATADPVYGPPAVPGFTAGLECANLASHYAMVASDRTNPECGTTNSCSFGCP